MADGSAYHDEMMAELLGDFLDESEHLVARLNETLLTVDQMLREGAAASGLTGRGAEMLNEMFRAAHSLKGLSGMLGFEHINQLTHRMENVFDAARKGQLALDAVAVEILFRAVDCLSAQLDSIRRGEGEGPPPEDILQTISELLQQAGVDRPMAHQRDAEAILRHLAVAEEIVNEAVLQYGQAEFPGESGEASSPSASLPTGVDLLQDRDPAAMERATGNDLAQGLADPPGPSADSSLESAGKSTAEGTGSSQVPVTAGTDDPFAEIVDDNLAGMANYLAIFVDEARSSLDELHELLLSCEEDGDPRASEKLMVIAHRIKGAAAAVGLRRAAKLAHLAEDFLQTLGERCCRLGPDQVELLLKAVDALRTYVDKIAAGVQDVAVLEEPARRLKQQVALLEQTDTNRPTAEGVSTIGITSSQMEAEAKDAPAVETTDSWLPEVPEEFRQLWQEAASSLVPRSLESRQGYVGVVCFGKTVQLVGLKARLVVEKLAGLGEIVYCHPPVDLLEEAENITGLLFACWSDAPVEQLRRQLSVGGVEQVIIRCILTGGSAGGETTPGCRLENDKAFPATSVESSSDVGRDIDGKESQRRKVPDSASHLSSDGCVSPSESAQDARASRSISPGHPFAAFGSQKGQVPAETGASRDGSGGATRASQPGSQVGETLRVDIERLDELMNLTGELVIQRARLNQLVENLRTKMAGSGMAQTIRSLRELLGRVYRDGAKADIGPRTVGSSQAQAIWNLLQQLEAEQRQWVDLRAVTNELRVSVHQLDRITDRLQQTVMNTRMVPIGPLFHRFKRVVRDLVRSSGKQIRLVINGEKTELDKRMIDELADPLIHLVRNAADHGIEPPEERIRRGKPPEGTLVLEACHKGNAILIRVSDDGRGLDAEKIRRKAVEKGFLTAAEVERLSAQEVYQLIWRPGLSTAEKVTEISGRGMGMDIVKAKIEALNGSVEVYTEPGVGTTFSIKLPLTLAILPSLLVRVAQNTFALPVDTIVEIVQLAQGDIATVQGVPTAIVRGRVIPICRLQELFVWNDCGTGQALPYADAANLAGDVYDKVTLVILADRQREIGLQVDYVIGEEDLVIKSLADNYRNIPGLTGASILGDGSVALILDVSALVEMASRAGGGRWI